MYIGIDLGTSDVKALLMTQDQAVRAEASAPLLVSRPRSGWVEQDPADWIAATETVLSDLDRRHDLPAVRGIGLSGQMHGVMLLDKNGRILRPPISLMNGSDMQQAP